MNKALLILCAASSLVAADYAAEGKLWWEHVRFLADDKLAGRNTGSEGYRKAAEYVASHFETFGLKPGGDPGYEQQVRFQVRTLVADQSTAALVRDGKSEQLQLGTEGDATLSSRNDSSTVDAPMFSWDTGW